MSRRKGKPKRASYADLAFRRDCVRIFDRMGFRRAEIVATLTNEGHLAGYKNPYRVIDKDLKVVRKQDRREIDAQTQEAAWYEYIARLERMYFDAMCNHSFRAALEVAKSKARAKGLRVDEPIVLQSKVDIEITVKRIIRLVSEVIGNSEALDRILKGIGNAGLLPASGSEVSTVPRGDAAAGPPIAELEKKAG